MVNSWEPGTFYGQGSVVEYEGHCYKIIQPHTSQGDWTPPVTPALWGRLPVTAPEYGERQQQGTYQPDGEQKPWHEQDSQKVDIPHEERKKHWYDLDDHRKKQLEIGGGLAAGVALLGAGYYAYHQHQKSEEQKKAQAWSLQNWAHDAQTRATEFHTNGPRAPVTWVLTHGTNIPRGALPGGQENGQSLFIARVFFEGGIHVGKAGSHLQQGAAISFNDKEIPFETFEILMGDERAVRWITVYGNLQLDSLQYTLVEGGREEDGTPLFIAQAQFHGGVHPGKASAKLNGAYIAYGGKEECVKEYRVLAYA